MVESFVVYNVTGNPRKDLFYAVWSVLFFILITLSSRVLLTFKDAIIVKPLISVMISLFLSFYFSGIAFWFHTQPRLLSCDFFYPDNY